MVVLVVAVENCGKALASQSQPEVPSPFELAKVAQAQISCGHKGHRVKRPLSRVPVWTIKQTVEGSAAAGKAQVLVQVAPAEKAELVATGPQVV
jgi:hypothetical protein